MAVKKNERRGLSTTQAIFPLVGTIMGSGMLTLPQSVEKSGLYFSGLILLAVISMGMFSVFELVYCAKLLNKKNPTYFDVCSKAFPFLGYVAEMCIGAQGLGCCYVYLLVLREWISKMLGIDHESLGLGAKFLLTLAIAAVPVFLAAQKDLKKIAFASKACTVSVLYLALFVMASGALSLIYLDLSKSDLKKTYTRPYDLFLASFDYIFSTGFQQNIVSIFSMLEKPTVKNGVFSGISALLLSAFVFFFVSNGGYIAGGNNQKKSILDVLEDPTRDFHKKMTEVFGPRFFYLVTLAKVGMVIVLVSAYPTQMHPTRDAFLTFLKVPLKKAVETNKRATEIVLITVISLVLLTIGVFSKWSYAPTMRFIAVTASCYIMFLLPSLSYLSLAKKKDSKYAGAALLFAMSVAISTMGTYDLIFSKKA